MKKKVLKRKHFLKVTNIFVDDDLSLAERGVQLKIREVFKRGSLNELKKNRIEDTIQETSNQCEKWHYWNDEGDSLSKENFYK